MLIKKEEKVKKKKIIKQLVTLKENEVKKNKIKI